MNVEIKVIVGLRYQTYILNLCKSRCSKLKYMLDLRIEQLKMTFKDYINLDV